MESELKLEEQKSRFSRIINHKVTKMVAIVAIATVVGVKLGHGTKTDSDSTEV